MLEADNYLSQILLLSSRKIKAESTHWNINAEILCNMKALSSLIFFVLHSRMNKQYTRVFVMQIFDSLNLLPLKRTVTHPVI